MEEKIYKLKFENLLNDIIKMSKECSETEKLTGDIVWGECALDLSQIIENHAEQS